MTAIADPIVLVGAGRMGRGLAHTFAFAGRAVKLVDLKPREKQAFQNLVREARNEIESDLQLLCELDVLAQDQVGAVMDLIDIVPAGAAAPVLKNADIIVEGVPETRAVKSEAFAQIGRTAARHAIVASTTSTMLVTELQELITGPERFLNTHFLNPAYLMPLVEVSPGPATDEDVIARTIRLLEDIGKVTVRCAPSPGYIVPRLQALLMAEACRMLQEGITDAEQIDKAIMYGFGPRYATMGLMEFIDWGGVDILYYAGNHLAKALNSPRHAPPAEVETMVKSGNRGLKEGRGFYDYQDIDVEAYRKGKLSTFIKLLRSIGRLPQPFAGSAS